MFVKIVPSFGLINYIESTPPAVKGRKINKLAMATELILKIEKNSYWEYYGLVVAMMIIQGRSYSHRDLPFKVQ